MHSFRACRSRLLVLLLILATGVAFGLVASNAARADDPEPTTVSTPTLPAPVPAPSPPPAASKPPPRKSPPQTRSTPAPKSTTPRPTSRIATPTTPTLAKPQPTSSPTRALPSKKRAKAKTARKAKAAIRRAETAEKKVKASETLGASVGFLVQPKARAGKPSQDSPLNSLVVILGCALAVACFLIALVPATAVPWRPAAIFISQRQLDLTLAGIALLGAALWFYVMQGL
jgi:cytoskeletal protein RodZ